MKHSVAAGSYDSHRTTTVNTHGHINNLSFARPHAVESCGTLGASLQSEAAAKKSWTRRCLQSFGPAIFSQRLMDAEKGCLGHCGMA